MMEPKSEAWIQYEILRLWGARKDVFTWRQNTGVAKMGNRSVRFGVPGAPDIMMIVAPWGTVVGVEVKSATGRQSPEQKRFQAAMEARGGVYCLARSVVDVDNTLAQLGITR